MVHQVTHFNDALSAWEQWNLADFDFKLLHLTSFKQAIEAQDITLAKLIDFHLIHATKLLKVQSMPGPTGETNELYTSGRGVTLVVIDKIENDTENHLFCAFSLIICALISGNSLIICSDNIELNSLLNNALTKAKLPINLVQMTDVDASAALLENDVRAIGYLGNDKNLHSLNLSLAKRQGAIVSLIYETNSDNSALIHDPLLCLRFITERTRTINITAVGGNATLLEMGNSAKD